MKDEEIADMIEGFRIIITHCPRRFCYHRAKKEKHHSNRCPLPTLDLLQNLVCPPASRLHLKKQLLSIGLSIFQTVSFAHDIALSFYLEVAFIDKTAPMVSAISALTTSDRG